MVTEQMDTLSHSSSHSTCPSSTKRKRSVLIGKSRQKNWSQEEGRNRTATVQIVKVPQIEEMVQTLWTLLRSTQLTSASGKASLRLICKFNQSLKSRLVSTVRFLGAQLSESTCTRTVSTSATRVTLEALSLATILATGRIKWGQGLRMARVKTVESRPILTLRLQCRKEVEMALMRQTLSSWHRQGTINRICRMRLTASLTSTKVRSITHMRRR